MPVNKVLNLEQYIRGFTLPPGIPLPWPQDRPPAGWFECNGASFDVNQFPRLASVFPWGRLPDLRGEFIRGWDNARGIDPYRVILSWQEDAIRNITGTFKSSAGNYNGEVQTGAFALTGTKLHGAGYSGYFEHSLVDFDVSRVVPVGNQNRPRNLAFMYIVKTE
ncbi:hypothetical protein A9G24_08385 [Gilliamella sp. App6-5]|nr:hypothetical protein A9G24_08385 [Gilliamella apicola]